MFQLKLCNVSEFFNSHQFNKALDFEVTVLLKEYGS